MKHASIGFWMSRSTAFLTILVAISLSEGQSAGQTVGSTIQAVPQPPQPQPAVTAVIPANATAPVPAAQPPAAMPNSSTRSVAPASQAIRAAAAAAPTETFTVPNEWLVKYDPGNDADRVRRINEIKRELGPDGNNFYELESRRLSEFGRTILCRKPGTSEAVAAATANVSQVKAATASINARFQVAAAAAGNIPPPVPNLFVRIPHPPKATMLDSSQPIQAAAAGAGTLRAAAAAAPSGAAGRTPATGTVAACLPDATEIPTGHLWGLTLIHADYAWCGREPRSQPHPVPVAVLDTGINTTHPNLALNIDLYRKHIFIDTNQNVSTDTNVEDDNGHGSHVAGIISAYGEQGGANPKRVVGVNWSDHVIPIKFLDQDGFGTLDNAVRAIVLGCEGGEVKDKSPKKLVINMSWVLGGRTQQNQQAIDLLKEAIDRYKSNVLFVAAAGNAGSDGIPNDNDANPIFPACFQADNLISVLSIDRNDKLSAFSNFGANSVAIAAPGGSLATGQPTDDILSTYKDRDYAWEAGTSMAAAFVSGAAALVWADHPDWSPKQVKDWLSANGRQVNDLKSKCKDGKVLDLAALSKIAVPSVVAPTPIASPGHNSNPPGTNVATSVNSPGATTSVTTNVTGPSGVNVTVTVNVSVNGNVVPLQELDLNYSQPWAFTPAASASPYVPVYTPSWPPGGTSFFTIGTPLACDPCSQPASWGPSRGFHSRSR